MVSCKKCGTENEDWQEHCEKCGARLKKVKFSSTTTFAVVLCLFIDVGITILNVYGVIHNYQNLKNESIIKSIFIMLMLLIATAGVVLLKAFKKRCGIIINLVATLIASIYIAFSSPMMIIILLAPSIFVLLTVLPQWRELKM